MTLGGAAQLAAPIARTIGLWTPQSAARQNHPCPSQSHYGLQPAMFTGNDLLFFSIFQYYQVLITTCLPTQEGWKAELNGSLHTQTVY